MRIDGCSAQFTPLTGAASAWRATVDSGQWRALASAARASGGRLVALWGADCRDLGRGFELHAACAVHDGLAWATLALSDAAPSYPDISDVFPAALRMQRAASDLLGVSAAGCADSRPWLRHAAWPAHVHPLRRDFDSRAVFALERDDYPFVQVGGDGVHEIPVGPVHAGTIEPGHFRFSVIGERVLRLEERLGYKHKGIEKRFESLTLAEGARLAGRVSGDSTAAYSWAYAMAAECAAQVEVPPRAQWLRALLLERERIVNHLGDLGYLGNDAGLAFGLAQFSMLKEEWLRSNAALFAHRYLMDSIVPGGVSRDLDAAGIGHLRREQDRLQREVGKLKTIYDEHAGLQDRLIGAGRVAPELADRLGLCGLAGRAIGMAWDLRVQFPCVPYDGLEVRMATHRNGDVAARVTVRFEEIFESLRLCSEILDRMPLGAVAGEPVLAPDGAQGAGWVEGWRGEVLVALEAGPRGGLRRVHPHDPSWHNWPLLEHAVLGNIVPDFPLINKSFNLSYSGADV